MTLRPLSTGVAVGLTISNEVISEIVMQQHNRYKKQFEKDQQKIKSFGIFYGKCLRGNVISKNEHESLCNTFN